MCPLVSVNRSAGRLSTEKRGGALLLALAAFLLALSRERRVSVKPSNVTEELAIHMGRIANALENLADPLRDRSHFTASREPAPQEKVVVHAVVHPRPHSHVVARKGVSHVGRKRVVKKKTPQAA